MSQPHHVLHFEFQQRLVFDPFYVKQCLHCSDFSHFKEQCKTVKPSCTLCSGDHEFTNCDHKNKSYDEKQSLCAASIVNELMM